ncbi:MAG: hypothetical protein H0V12_12215 [Chloroflexi bacterium]|nr:hypothetical protein [Chloroflexota bacterium]
MSLPPAAGLRRTSLCLVLAIVMGCSASPPPEEVVRGEAGAPREVNVILRDYLFLPEPIELIRGETVRFNLINGGLLAHEFVLGGDEVQTAWADAHAAATPPGFLATAPPASVSPDVAGLRVLLASGEQAGVEYQVPTSTDIMLACHLPGHLEQGMVADVRLVARGAAET